MISKKTFFYNSLIFLFYIFFLTHITGNKEFCGRSIGCISTEHQPYLYYFFLIILTLPAFVLLYLIFDFIFLKNYTNRKMRNRIDIYLSRSNQLHDKNVKQIDDLDSSN
jgi:hypothetical protein